jgi:nucleotide-binding universal stress UspA family protein
MKTIIVPVDFSPASLNAVNYAMELANTIGGSITLVYVYQFPASVSEVPVSGEIINDLIADAENRMVELKKGLTHQWEEKIKIYTEIKEGNIIMQVKMMSSSLKPFAVVMGARGIGAVERVLFGSNTLQAIRHLSWPLIVVPIGATFKTIKKIGLACDLQKVPETVHAEEIKNIVKEFHAELHILHVNTKKEEMINDERIEGSEWLLGMLAEVEPEFHFVNKENIDEAINEFTEKNNLDMLIIIPKKHGLLEGLFHQSHAKQMALHAHLPVMAIHE